MTSRQNHNSPAGVRTNDKNREIRQLVDAKIDSTQRAIQNLQNLLYDLYESRNSTSLLLSVLTQDILAEIFLFAYEDSRIMPFIICGVCRAWKKTALQIPRLWNRLHIYFSPLNQDIQGQFLEELLSRSGALPLELHLFSDDEYTPPPGHLRPLIHSSVRWKVLHLSSGNFEYLRAECARLNCGFPLLRSVNMNIEESFSYMTSTPWNFLSSPISDFTITGQKELTNLVPWQNLQTFVGKKLNTTDCLFVLKKMAVEPSRCQSCTFHIAGHGDFYSSQHECYVLPQLKNFHLSHDMNGDPDMAQIFDNIEIPALSRLALTGFGIYDYTDPIVHALKRSNSSLLELVLNRASIEEPTLIAMLRQLPSLSSFSYSTRSDWNPVNITGRTIRFLNPELAFKRSGHDSAVCLPNLTHFSYTGAVDFDSQEVIDMLKARLRCSKSQALPMKMLLSFKISYWNKTWIRDLGVNEIRGFYQALFTLKTHEPAMDVDFSWEQMPKLLLG